MKGIVVTPGKVGAVIKDIEEPGPLKPHQVLLKTLYTGICGTDRGIVTNMLGFVRPPPDAQELVLGHEGLAEVLEVGDEVSGLRPGDMVVPMVRRPGGCLQCSIGRQDNCEDGDFVEAGIRGLNGFMRERFADEEQYLIKVEDKSLGRLAVLTEPLKNVVKAYEVYTTLAKRFGVLCKDSTYGCKSVTVAGMGPIGMLFAMIFATNEFNVRAFDIHDTRGTAAGIAKQVGFEFFTVDGMPEDIMKSDVFVDATGNPGVVGSALNGVKRNGFVILFGTSSGGEYKLTGELVTQLVEKNTTVFGSVDGAKEHYLEALNYISMWRDMFPHALDMLITDEDKPEGAITNLIKKPQGEIKRVIRWG